MATTARRSTRAVRALGAICLIGALSTGCQLGVGDGEEKAADSQQQEQTDSGSRPAGGSDGGSADATTEGPGGGESPAASDGGGDAVVDEASKAAGVDPSALGKPVATAEAPAIVEGDPKATMTVSLYSLTRSGDTVVGIYSFQVHSTKTDQEDWLYGYLGDQGWEPYLIDTKNLNKHGVMGAVNGAVGAQTEYQGAKFRPGQTFYAYAVFAAPPQDVTTMDASLGDGLPLATEVPIR